MVGSRKFFNFIFLVEYDYGLSLEVSKEIYVMSMPLGVGEVRSVNNGCMNCAS